MNRRRDRKRVQTEKSAILKRCKRIRKLFTKPPGMMYDILLTIWPGGARIAFLNRISQSWRTEWNSNISIILKNF